MSARLPTRVDRYPAKMVSHLADRLIDKYSNGAPSLLDPFAGSGAILVAAKKRGIKVAGADINPISALFAKVKLNGFEISRARRLLEQVLLRAATNSAPLTIPWAPKTYWFTPTTIAKFEAIRGAVAHLNAPDSSEMAAVLLSLSLSVRPCSRADQRSPKPFISKNAVISRKGRHFDPFEIVPDIFEELCRYHGMSRPSERSVQFFVTDLGNANALRKLPRFSRIVTSPPYLNAQDYFRNFKLELHVLEGLLPFKVDAIKNHFIGTERGVSTRGLSAVDSRRMRTQLPVFGRLIERSPHSAAVVYRYFRDMEVALRAMRNCLSPGGVVVIVCGDNLVAGERIKTWKILSEMIERLGLKQFDSFADPIKDRLLAPKRSGHIGLIKEEIVMAFRDCSPAVIG